MPVVGFVFSGFGSQMAFYRRKYFGVGYDIADVVGGGVVNGCVSEGTEGGEGNACRISERFEVGVLTFCEVVNDGESCCGGEDGQIQPEGETEDILQDDADDEAYGGQEEGGL